MDMNTRVRVIEKSELEELQDAINYVLRLNSVKKVIDIKYEIYLKGDYPSYTAMIIFETEWA